MDAYTGQGGYNVALTEQWDYATLMEHSYGVLPNSHTNVLKAYGFYQVNPEWRFGGNLYISSGRPVICLGLFGPNQVDPVGYGSAYHWCGGKPRPPGSLGNTPWIHQLDLSVNYSPAWMDHDWNFNLAVFNVFNNQTATQYVNTFGSTSAPDPTYHLIEGRTPPRMVRFYVSYDF